MVLRGCNTGSFRQSARKSGQPSHLLGEFVDEINLLLDTQFLKSFKFFTMQIAQIQEGCTT